MTLPVPLAVRVGTSRVTSEVRSLSFRKEAIGGVRSISFSLARPLSRIDSLDPLATVAVYDRSATCVAQGRLVDTGRSASAEGERWDCLAYGPAQHATDISAPLIYVDKGLEGWKFERIDLAGAGATFDAGAQPIATAGAQGLLASWQDGTVVNTNSLIAIRYAGIMNAGQKVARIAYLFIAGTTTVDWQIDTVFSTDGNWGASNTGAADSWNALGGSRAQIVGADFTNGRNVVDVRTVYKGAGPVAVSGAGSWAWVQPVVEAIRLTKAGAEITSGYGGGALVHEIVADLLGRLLPDFDGANATISTGATHFVDQMAYPDGTTAAAVLDDLMGFEPGYRWYTRPAATVGGKYRFEWGPWPTTIRYEATLEDGGSFPLSMQDVYNVVGVRWKDELGRVHITVRTKACPILDDQGLTRRANIDLGAEVGSATNATAAGDAFLNDHNVPKNGGTLTVARPIRDLVTGSMVQPWQIEPGELVRVRGVEAYPNAFNTSTNDGVGVFRIFALDYTSDGNTATLALDSDPRETEDALVLLLNEMKKKGRR